MSLGLHLDLSGTALAFFKHWALAAFASGYKTGREHRRDARRPEEDERMQFLSTWRQRAAVSLSFLSLVGLVAGCSNAPTSTTSSGTPAPEMSIDLAKPDGGTGTSNEAPYFGDRYFATYLNEDLDTDVPDPVATSTQFTAAEARPAATVKFLRVIWGDMHQGPDASDSSASVPRTDWSGDATVSDGVLIPLRTLAFERGDYIVPRWLQAHPDLQRVDWVSHTTVGKDGILFAIAIPAPGDTSWISHGDGLTDDDMFTFTTGPLTISFPISQIAGLDSMVTVDAVNGVSFQGFDRSDLDDLCMRGSLEGAWVKVQDDEHQGGFFRAAWIGPLGRVIGHVRGRWGVLNGEQVFVGKIIRRDGSFYAHIRGTWAPDPDHLGTGTFQGRFGVNGNVLGGERGMWAVSPRIDQGGFLRGMWKRFCDRDGQTM
jgi:hypothetical protein